MYILGPAVQITLHKIFIFQAQLYRLFVHDIDIDIYIYIYIPGQASFTLNLSYTVNRQSFYHL